MSTKETTLDRLLPYASSVSKRVQIGGIRLVKSCAQHDTQRQALPRNVEFGLRSTTEIDQDAKKIYVRPVFWVDCRHEDGDPSAEAALHIDAEFVVEYALTTDDSIDAAHAEAFGRMNGIHNAWSYWREYLQSMTTRMGLPPLTLPLLTVDALLKTYRDEEAEEKAQVEQAGPSAVG